MSNHLAIATVTATLQHLLQTALVANDLSATVTTLRPEHLAQQTQNAGVNIYLYHVAPNIALRNNDLPSRRTDGTIVQRSQVALDLSYLLTFYGQEAELTPQRMLGAAVSALRSEAMLTRDMVRNVVVNAPQSLDLSASDLMEQTQLVKFTLLPLDLQGLHSLWSLFFPTPYYLSVAYKASVVLIDGPETPQPALPVRDRQPSVGAFLAPLLEAVVSAKGQAAPIVAEDTLLIRGQHLSGQGAAVRIGGVTITPQTITDQQLQLTLPETLRPGVQAVQIVTPSGIESNAAAIVLRPSVTQVKKAAGSTADTVDLTIYTRPGVGQAQRVVVLLNELSANKPAAYALAAPARQKDDDPIVVTVSGVKPADYLVRVQVDGAESPLTVTDNQYSGPKVTLP